MTPVSGRLLYWAPRALSVLFIGFLSLFALDVSGEGLGFWQTAQAPATYTSCRHSSGFRRAGRVRR